jgi:hypothetical protein
LVSGNVPNQDQRKYQFRSATEMLNVKVEKNPSVELSHRRLAT